MKKAVTIKSIAEQLNLSRNTVAKALNGQYVPESTRELVLKKAQEMNYKSLNAANIELGSKKYRILLVAGKPLINMSYFIPLVKSIENSCYARNYELFQYTYTVRSTPFSSFAEYVKELNVDGIVAIECFDKDFVSKMINMGKPICFNDFTAASLQLNKNFDIISTNDEKSICEIVKYIHTKYNTKNFTFVGDPTHCLSFYERHTGMRMGIYSITGTTPSSRDILCRDESFDYGNPDAIKTEILKLKYKPECFICCNDFVARNVCEALKRLNMRIPQDVMVVGFDNVPEATAMHPEITSFSINKEFLGSETLRTLVNRIEHPETPSRIITVSTTRILRESTNRFSHHSD
ncbi:MAG: LacI family DNA-binding transcriptional regulator [Clostridiales bacterium]|nr:LacI family DNA-binding transcriptional regulator [Clostridiales bacterium]